jgi:hypothetical protein
VPTTLCASNWIKTIIYNIILIIYSIMAFYDKYFGNMTHETVSITGCYAENARQFL